ncbi:hypothetical protein NFHSH190041_19540 [Shewanella sp. NFH-SH190041]|uniref:DUF3108 domain-containing protein n=1 Tax=Shewanella sp. NFH-SH190041 TaxID=2950245 RepID=UPI0021C3FCA6|nr:DUF3108 domain-containing protein [Shewanella sp. NFH-SH190041]BDM64502.1 hypothetical protein NFHSH190041_19540 [Shewanella sp. NFH-SH190041]
MPNLYRPLLLLTSFFSPLAHAQSPLTPQTAEYQVFYGDIDLGKARYRLEPPSDSGVYSYYLDSALSLLVLSDIRHIRSEFTRDPQHPDTLLPIRYMQEREGTGPNFREQTAFARQQGNVYTRYKDKKGTFPYHPGLYDPLMVQLQFRLDISRGKTPLDYEMVKSNEIDDYQFKIVGKERVNLPSGSYNTVKIAVVRSSKKRQTFFWMSPELSYLPVRLTHFEKGDKQLDIQLLNYHYMPDRTTPSANSAASTHLSEAK